MNFEFEFLNDPLLVALFAVFAFSLLVQLGYFWIVFSRLAFIKPKQTSGELSPVSLVITAHNQYNDLEKNLPYFLEQDYPEFEVMVVNDNSEDGSTELLQDFSQLHGNLSVVELKQSLNWFKGRKFPLSLGIKSAKHEILILTDITCRPVSKEWVKEMVSVHTQKSQIVLAYSTFDTKSKMNLWFRFSAFYDGLFYLSMALTGKPFKGIGKNLSYKKQLFYDHKGFSSHYKINVGDDEIFINQTAKKRNTLIQLSPKSKVAVVKPISFAKWLKGEKSRILIRRFFKTGSRLLISLFNTTALLFFASFAALLIFGFDWMLLIPLFGLRLISQYVIFGLAAKKLDERNLLLFSPVFELFQILIDFFIWLTLLFGRKNKWR
jgi:cellulose synthase/poly-beta-1,6-N-acetylglucosamine synthase-like glycosyltransferase